MMDGFDEKLQSWNKCACWEKNRIGIVNLGEVSVKLVFNENTGSNVWMFNVSFFWIAPLKGINVYPSSTIPPSLPP